MYFHHVERKDVVFRGNCMGVVIIIIMSGLVGLAAKSRSHPLFWDTRLRTEGRYSSLWLLLCMYEVMFRYFKHLVPVLHVLTIQASESVGSFEIITDFCF